MIIMSKKSTFEMSIRNTTNFLYFLVFIATLSSCQVAAPPALPTAEKMPDTYIGNSDTLTDGSIRWQEFFTDPLLVDLIQTGLKNNLDLLTAIQRVEMARANYDVRAAALLPSLYIAATADIGTVNQNMVSAAAQDQTVNNFGEEYFLGLQSTWEADLWGKLKNQKKAAHARFLASEKGKHLVTTALVAEIAR